MWVQAGDGALRGPALDAFCRLLDTLPTAGCLCDAEGRIVYYTARAAALWGCSPSLAADDAPRYCGAHRLYSFEGVPLAAEDGPMARALATKSACHNQHVQIERPDGSRRIAVAYASPMLDADGALEGGLSLLLDVTDRHCATRTRAERARQREELRVALACDIRAGLDPLRRNAQDLAGATLRTRAPVDAMDRQLRHVTQLVDRLLNLEVDLDDALA